MARVTYGPLITGASGSLGDITLKATGGAAVAAKRKRKTSLESSAAIQHRLLFSQLRAKYKELTTAEKNSWQNLARQTVTTDNLGVTRPRTAFGLFVEFNWIPYRYNHTYVTEASISYRTTPVSGIILTSAPLFPLYIFAGTFLSSFVAVWQVEGRRATNGPGGRNWTTWQPITFGVITDPTQNIKTDWLAAGLACPIGTWMQVRVRYQAVDYFPTPPLLSEIKAGVAIS